MLVRLLISGYAHSNELITSNIAETLANATRFDDDAIAVKIREVRVFGIPLPSPSQ